MAKVLGSFPIKMNEAKTWEYWGIGKCKVCARKCADIVWEAEREDAPKRYLVEMFQCDFCKKEFPIHAIKDVINLNKSICEHLGHDHGLKEGMRDVGIGDLIVGASAKIVVH